MEQVLDWLNENEARAFPLLSGVNNREFQLSSELSWTFPDNFLLDLQLIYTQGKLLSPVALKHIIYIPNTSVLISFGSNESTIATFQLALSLISTAAFPLYLRSPGGSLAVFGEGLKSFVNLCGELNITLNTNLPIEPSLCSEFSGPWLGVSGIITEPEKVSAPESHVPQLPLDNVESPNKLTGDIRFLEGYNFNVIIDNSLINLAVDKGYGLPMDCSTSFLNEIYLDCAQIISYINGVPPDENGKFTITSGDNINIISGMNTEGFNDAFLEQSNSHTLFVGLNFDASTICKPVNITPSLL
jgi:hypothetical protein